MLPSARAQGDTLLTDNVLESSEFSAPNMPLKISIADALLRVMIGNCDQSLLRLIFLRGSVV